MYIPRARVEYDMQALTSAISGLARSSNVSIAVFDPQAKLVAQTVKINTQLWGAKLKYRLQHVPISISESTMCIGDYPVINPAKEAKLRQWLWMGGSVRQEGEEIKHPDTDLWILPDNTSVATTSLWRDYTLIGFLVVWKFYDKRCIKGDIVELPNNFPVLTSKQIHDIIESAKDCIFDLCGKIVYPDPELFEHLEQYIFANSYKPINVKSLSEEFNIYPEDIREIFPERAFVGLPSYVSYRKFSVAQDLLWQTDLSVEEIAQKIGFDETRLRKRMRSFYRCSPEEYREKTRRDLSKKIPIAFVTNDGYAPYLSTAIHSVIANRDPQKEYAIFVFYSNLSFKSIKLLESLGRYNVKIICVDLKEQMQPYENLFYTFAHYTQESYYRLFLPLFLGRLYERFIYLDVDLVVNCDIGNILTEADPTKTVNAVLNYSTMEDDNYIKSLGLDTMSYINAGVMVVNCNRYIQSDYFGKAVKCMERREKYLYVDQDVLNQICQGDIGIIDPAWNVQWNNIGTPDKFIAKINELVSNIQSPYIVHYTIDKPWKIMLNELGDYYWKYAKENSSVLERFGIESERNSEPDE